MREPRDRKRSLLQPARGQALSYQIGKLQITRLLAEARLQQGDKSNLRAFHDFVWKNGNVPIALQRWELLGKASPEDNEYREQLFNHSKRFASSKAASARSG